MELNWSKLDPKPLCCIVPGETAPAAARHLMESGTRHLSSWDPCRPGLDWLIWKGAILTSATPLRSGSGEKAWAHDWIRASTWASGRGLVQWSALPCLGWRWTPLCPGRSLDLSVHWRNLLCRPEFNWRAECIFWRTYQEMERLATVLYTGLQHHKGKQGCLVAFADCILQPANSTVREEA